MTQDTGAARLAGATQLYNIILPEGKEYMDKLVNTEKGEGYDAAKSNNARQVFTDKERSKDNEKDLPR